MTSFTTHEGACLYRVDDELKDFLESGVAAVVGTASADGRPHVARAWGMRVCEGREAMSIFLETARAAATLADLEATGLIAVTVASPVTYRSVQLKGRWSGKAEADSEDLAWVQRHRDAFATEAALVGDPPNVVRSRWMQDLFRVDFAIERAFDQTPGPLAGQPL